jgi:hypothetical protein
LPEATSLPRELIARLKRRMLPQLEDELDLYAALHATDPDAADAEWIAGLSEADVSEWRELLGSSAGHILAAMRLLAIRAAAIGLSRGVMKVMPHRCEAESPFLNLLDAADQFARSPGGADTRDELQETIIQLPGFRRHLACAPGGDGRFLGSRLSPGSGHCATGKDGRALAPELGAGGRARVRLHAGARLRRRTRAFTIWSATA